MGVLAWIVFGLIAGVLAKILMPGPDPGGIIVTVLLGIAGSYVGGFIATQLGYGSHTEFDWRSLGIAIGGAFLILFLYRAINQRR